MSDNVAPLKPPVEEDRIWVCGHCGCQTFYLYEDGTTECAVCNFRDVEQRGGWAEKVEPDSDFDDSKARRSNANMGTASFARAAVLKAIDEETCVIVAIWPTGRIKLWSEFGNNESPERRQWLKDAMRNAASLALGEPDSLDELPE